MSSPVTEPATPPAADRLAARERAARERTAPFAAEYPFEPHFHWRSTPAGDAALHYVDEGARDAAPMLLVHGNPTWSFFYRNAIRHFSDRHRCVAPDHVGCGLSDKPRGWSYTLRSRIDDLEALVLALDLDNITLVVHDWGGAIGMGFAARHPERVARFVVLNTAAFRSERIPRRIAMCKWPLLGGFAVRGLNGFARAATFMAVERPLPAAVKRGFLAPYSSIAERAAVHEFVRDIPMRPDHPSWPTLVEVEESLHALADRPALLVWGERDWCFTPHFREEWQRRWPHAEVATFDDAGHYLLEDAGDAALTRIDDFLTRHPLP